MDEIIKQIYILVEPLIKGSLITLAIIAVVAVILAIFISKKRRK